MSQAEIGLIGLGVMGSNLALNIAEKGNRIAVFNRTPERTDAFMASAGNFAADLVPAKTMEDFIASIRPPRPVIIMEKAGEAVDEQIAALKKLMAKNDIVIDAGNANFRDTMRRFQDLDGSGLTFIDIKAREQYAAYGKARDTMLKATHAPHAPWFVVNFNEQKRGRLNLIEHLLKQLPRREPPAPAPAMPKLAGKPLQEKIPRGFLIDEPW